VTFSPEFKVTILLNIKYFFKKRYKIELYLQWHQITQKLYIWSSERRHFQWPWTTQTQFSRSRYSLTLNISSTVKDTAIVTMEGK